MQIRIVLPLALLITITRLAAASEVSPQNPVGWRGDGTGIYPDATPPVSWGRIGPVMKGLRCQAAKPKGEGESGNSISFGVITDWLVLGPFDVKDHEHPLDDAIIGKEEDVQPDEGEKVGNLAWKAVKLENHFAEFEELIGKANDKGIYAHSYLYSPVAGEIRIRTWSNYAGKKTMAFNLLVNGKSMEHASGRCVVKKGWNRVLLKMSKLDTTPQFFFKMSLRSAEPCAYESSNIVWSLPIPFSASSPIIVGEKIFVCYEPYFLACFNKADGKLLWIRSNGYQDAADASEKAAHANEFRAVDALAAKIEKIDTDLLKSAPSSKPPAERAEHVKEIEKLMLQVDAVKYKPNPEQVGNAFHSGMTPCSDGKNIYAWYGLGITVCYDLDGNRKWIRVDNNGWSHHGYASSPLLVDGKVVVYMRGVKAFDCNTGALAWEQVWKPGSLCLFGSWIKAAVGSTTVIAAPQNACALRASDGKILFGQLPNGGTGISSPVFDGKVVYTIEQLGPLNRIELTSGGADGVIGKSLKPIDFSATQFPVLHLGKHNYASSPVLYEGLLYAVDAEGDLVVVDTQTESVVYQRKLDINALFAYNGWPHVAGVCASLCIAGKKLYIQGNTGVMMILEPGREFKLIARNKIEDTGLRGSWDERQESTICTPVFDGSRIYIRSENNLYCVGEK